MRVLRWCEKQSSLLQDDYGKTTGHDELKTKTAFHTTATWQHTHAPTQRKHDVHTITYYNTYTRTTTSTIVAYFQPEVVGAQQNSILCAVPELQFVSLWKRVSGGFPQAGNSLHHCNMLLLLVL